MFDEENESPMWTGRNSRQEKIQKEKRQFSVSFGIYHKSMKPVTSYSIAVETLRRSLKITGEAKRDAISVTYDAEIVKFHYRCKWKKTNF